MVNPFISVDEQLSRIGWNVYYDGDKGFHFVKKIGIEVWHSALFWKSDYGMRFFDPILEKAIEVNEKELELFAAKIKEWRRRNGRNSEVGRHYSKKQS